MDDNVIDIGTKSAATEAVREDDNGNKVIDLVYPVLDPKGEKVVSLTFRRPTAGDLQAMDDVKGDTAKAIRALSRVCDVTPGVVSRLDAYDFIKAQEVLAGFLSKPR